MIHYNCPICGRTTCNSGNIVAPCPVCAKDPDKALLRQRLSCIAAIVVVMIIITVIIKVLL